MSNPFLGLGFENSFITFSRPGRGLGLELLYDFTEWTFTAGNGFGSIKPTVFTAYENEVWYSQYFSVLNGIQYWTAPSSGTYRIRAAGGAGSGGLNANGNRGIIIESDIQLVKGQQYKILIGHRGTTFANNIISYASGGGGGTFMATSENVPVIVAGGGGGGFATGYTDGTINESGQNSGTVLGGTNGNGGRNATSQNYAGGGGGFYGNGADGPLSGFQNGFAFVNGGGAGVNSDGGFGGGGGYWGGISGQGNGGGGGYSGGAAGQGSNSGGGGGSYSQTTKNLIGYNTGFVSLKITKL
jgi:hypothetical protein